MGAITDWFKNAEHKQHMSGPHTGTGNSGAMGTTPSKVVFRDASGKRITTPRKTR